MAIHFNTRAAAEAHLISKGFRKGPTRWFKGGDLFARIAPISGSEVVCLFVWQEG